MYPARKFNAKAHASSKKISHMRKKKEFLQYKYLSNSYELTARNGGAFG